MAGSILVAIIYAVTHNISYLGYGVGGILCVIGMYNIYILYKYFDENKSNGEEDYEDN